MDIALLHPGLQVLGKCLQSHIKISVDLVREWRDDLCRCGSWYLVQLRYYVLSGRVDLACNTIESYWNLSGALLNGASKLQALRDMTPN